MSYDLAIYRPPKGLSEAEIRARLSGEGPYADEEFIGEPIPVATVEAVLAKYPSEDGLYGQGAVQVEIFDSEISLSMPYWGDKRDSLAEMVKIALDIRDAIDGLIWDSQMGEFVKGKNLEEQLAIFDEMSGVVSKMGKKDGNPLVNWLRKLGQPPK